MIISYIILFTNMTINITFPGNRSGPLSHAASRVGIDRAHVTDRAGLDRDGNGKITSYMIIAYKW